PSPAPPSRSAQRQKSAHDPPRPLSRRGDHKVNIPRCEEAPPPGPWLPLPGRAALAIPPASGLPSSQRGRRDEAGREAYRASVVEDQLRPRRFPAPELNHRFDRPAWRRAAGTQAHRLRFAPVAAECTRNIRPGPRNALSPLGAPQQESSWLLLHLPNPPQHAKISRRCSTKPSIPAISRKVPSSRALSSASKRTMPSSTSV